VRDLLLIAHLSVSRLQSNEACTPFQRHT